MKFSNKTYDVIKWIAQIFLPALITLYGCIATACGIPHTDTVVTIGIGVDTFLGSILGLSSRSYYSDKDGDGE